MNVDYPFAAVVGNDDLKRALSLCVIDPSIGGVVIEGDRGSAKINAGTRISTVNE